MGSSRERRVLDPDAKRATALNGRSEYLAQRLAIGDAVRELRELADGRDDLVGTTLGGILGGYVGDPGMTNPYRLLGAALLAQLRFDLDAFRDAHEESERNATPPTQRPGTT